MNRGNERSYHHVLMREIMRGNRVDQADADTVAYEATNATDVGFGLAGNADMNPKPRPGMAAIPVSRKKIIS